MCGRLSGDRAASLKICPGTAGWIGMTSRSYCPVCGKGFRLRSQLDSLENIVPPALCGTELLV